MRRLALLATLLAAPLLGAADTPPTLQVHDVWSRAVPGHTGVLYFSVTDSGAADRLLSVSTPAASSAVLHETVHEGNVMKMRPVAALPVDPGKTLVLAPGGYHVMLVGLVHPLKAGQSFPVTLTFEHAGAIAATATVQKAGASKPAHASMPGMPGMDN